jgi:hypothetical protein
MSETVEFQWRRRYGLPPTDPRYLSATREEILVDWWAHQHTDDPKLRDEVLMDEEDFQAELAEMEAASIAAQAAGQAEEWEDVVADHYGGEQQP